LRNGTGRQVGEYTRVVLVCLYLQKRDLTGLAWFLELSCFVRWLTLFGMVEFERDRYAFMAGRAFILTMMTAKSPPNY
jgi:hypothetical protein